MIFEDLAQLFEELEKHNKHKDIARHFDRERKFVISMKCGCGFHMTPSFIAGLKHFGYELKLMKIEGDK